ncbi:MAG: DUF624 domain-containing protein [Defluviitaleaceae bacterium]|nr:DUF624 domain-containing protein [Defluviitaleaceae bacterium]MCL2264040.1 DUF624 domain-containing protein [Defluviitaleaceae bacterium]
MREFFSLEGSFNRYAGFAADTFILSLAWIFFSLPIITIGASTTALFYVATRRIANREGYITSDFWMAFKSNFLRATLVWIVILFMVVMILISMLAGIQMGEELPFNRIVLPVQIVTLLEILFVSTFVFPVLARFEMGIKEAVKASFFMANRHLLTSFTCVGIAVGLVIFVFMFPQIFPLIFLVPGISGMLSAVLIMRVFKKYRPEMDKDPILELQEIEKKRAEEKRLAEIGKTHIINENDENNEEEQE